MIINQPEDLPETDIVSQHIFDQGHEVDELSKKLYSSGIDIPTASFTTPHPPVNRSVDRE
jgi:hypothetical protein